MPPVVSIASAPCPGRIRGGPAGRVLLITFLCLLSSMDRPTTFNNCRPSYDLHERGNAGRNRTISKKAITDMRKLTVSSRIGGPRPRWVGQPMEPQNARGKSPSGKQKYYGAVELPGAGGPIYVNDVVQILPKDNSGGSGEERFRLTQVLSMWEDTFTGVFKFRARLLIHESDLPQDVFSRLCAARRTFSTGIRSSKDDKPGDDGEVENNEVFLTPKMEDLEVRLIVKSVTLSVTPSPKTAIPVDLKRNMGPRLTHTYDDSTGDFVPVDDTDPLLKRARVRQSEAVDIASRANEEHDTAKNGEPMKSIGWLLPKRSFFYSKGRGEIGRHYRHDYEVNNGTYYSAVSPVHVGSPVFAIDMETSKDGELEVVSNFNNEASKKGVDRDGDATSTDNDPSGSSKEVAMTKGDFMLKKSAKKLKSQRFLDSDAKVNSDSFAASFFSTPILSSSSQRHNRATATTGVRSLPCRPRRLDMPPVSKGGQQVAVPADEGDACTTIDNHLKTKKTRSSSRRVASEAQVKNSRKLPGTSASGSPTSAVKRSKVSGKRRRRYTNPTTNATDASANDGFADTMVEEEPGYPPSHTPVGKEFQTDIPDLLSYEERKRTCTGTSARMVWRSIRDWDPQSRGMLAEYLHAAKEVVQAKQARPDVAVHVRLGDISVRVDQEDSQIDSIDRVGSYAVWAVTAGSDTCDVVRVACSEIAQTEVPRSAVQIVQCEEEALAALVKARCTLDNFEPALDILAKPSSGPQSVEQWTLDQVRTLEKALHDEFDPKRRLHGWARPGMTMDREDFIDLAKVSKRVPGKTPAQVLAFYYKYLAAAEPLIDVVYGPKAAEDRRQEKIPQDCEVNKQYYLGGGPARSSSLTTNIKVGSTQNSDGSQRAIPGSLTDGVGSASGNGVPKRRLSSSKSHVLRLPSPKPSKEHILKASKTDVDQPTAVDISVGHVDYEEAEPPLLLATIGKYGSSAGKYGSGLTSPNLPLPRRNRSSHAVDGITSVGSGPTEEPFDRTSDDDEGGHCALNKPTSRARAVISNDVDRNADGGGVRHAVIQHGRRAGHSSTASSPDPPPPLAEIFEVQDRDEEARSQFSAGDRRRTLPIIPGVTYTPYAVPIRGVGLTEVQRYAVWDSRFFPCYNHDPNIQRHDGRCIYGVGGSSTPDLATAPPDNNVQHTLEKAPTDDMFGVMAPCWRLLERAKLHMDEDQFVYMRGLILLHAKKPMSRDQLLERAESCLQEQGHIFAAFVKMFDRINQPASEPLYPTTKKQPGPSLSSGRRQVMPYTSTYALPITVPEHPRSAHYSSAPRTLRGDTGEHKTVPPGGVSICSADANRSPPGRAFSYPHPADDMPRGVWYPLRLGGDSDGLAQYPSGLDHPVMSITEYSKTGSAQSDPCLLR